MRSVILRLVARDRALFVGALLVGGAAAGFGAPIDFVLFGLMLAGIALFHHHPLQVALTGLAAIVAYELASGGLDTGAGPPGSRCTSSTSGSRSRTCWGCCSVSRCSRSTSTIRT